MSRQGQLLIAHPNLPIDHPFGQTVIYVGYDGNDGVTGLILNKTTNLSVSQFLHRRKLDTLNTGDKTMHIGGPVSTQSVFMLHSNDWESTTSIDAGNGLSISSDDFMLEKLALGHVPAYWRLFAGVCSWQAGQLDLELKGIAPYRPENSWLTCKPNDNIIYNYDGVDQWEKAMTLSREQLINSYI
jgi:putative transcriptional regulator